MKTKDELRAHLLVTLLFRTVHAEQYQTVMPLILSSHASSNTYRKLANTLIVFGLGLAFVTGAGQLTAAQTYLSSKPFSTSHAQHRYSITLSSASSNDICDDIDMAHINASATCTASPSTNESISSAFPSDSAPSSSGKAGSISTEDKMHHELLLVAMQKEELRRVEEENEMLRRMIEAYS